MSKFLKVSGSLGLVGMSFLLIREKQRYDSLPDKSKYVFFDGVLQSADKDKLLQVYHDSVSKVLDTLRLPQRQDAPFMKGLDHKPSPEHVEIAIVPLEYEEQDSSKDLSINAGSIKSDQDMIGSEKITSEKIDIMELMDNSTPENISWPSDISSSSDISHYFKHLGIEDVGENGDSQQTVPIAEVTTVNPSEIKESLHETANVDTFSPQVNLGNEGEKEDDSNVVDVKVAFSGESLEKILDPTVDISNQNLEHGKDSTLTGLYKNCVELGIVLGDLMVDVPDIQPRLDQVYKELQQLFHAVSNLQKEQDALISKALQEQGSEFSQVLEQQWENSVNAIEAQAQELQQEYSQKLDEFKVSYTHQMFQEQKEKLDNIRKEYEADKSIALSNLEQELSQKWEAIVAEKVDQERDGRLAKLDHLAVKVQVLQNVTEDIAFRLEQKYNLQKIEIALENLSLAVMKSPRSIEAEFNNLWVVGSKYPFITNILSSLPKDISVAGVIEYNDLLTSFLQLRKDISSIKYMPENGGAISYLISSFGPRSQIGEITLQVLENSSDAIANGDIDSAARQLNRLRGWQRVLSLDWIADARRFLELKQALDVIHDYVRLEKLEVI